MRFGVSGLYYCCYYCYYLFIYGHHYYYYPLPYSVSSGLTTEKRIQQELAVPAAPGQVARPQEGPHAGLHALVEPEHQHVSMHTRHAQVAHMCGCARLHSTHAVERAQSVAVDSGGGERILHPIWAWQTSLLLTADKRL